MGYVLSVKEKVFIPRAETLNLILALLDGLTGLEYNYEHNYDACLSPQNPKYFLAAMEVSVESLQDYAIGPRPPKSSLPVEIPTPAEECGTLITNEGVCDDRAMFVETSRLSVEDSAEESAEEPAF